MRQLCPYATTTTTATTLGLGAGVQHDALPKNVFIS